MLATGAGGGGEEREGSGMPEQGQVQKGGGCASKEDFEGGCGGVLRARCGASS